MIQHGNNNPLRFRNVILLLLVSGAAALLISPAFAGTGVTISADGSQSYYLGEKVVLQGQSPDADTVYLLLIGPNLPAAGVNLASPDKAVISGNPDSFTVVKTKPDKTWEYAFYTANLKLDAGTYTIYALSQPKTEDQPGPNAANVSLILRKPYITTGISPATISKGQQFTITGSAAGNPPAVQIWIIGDNYVFNKTSPVNPDGAFTFNADAAMSGKLPAGQNYLIVQHPMEDNQFDIVVSGDYVRNQKLNNGTNLFRITGSGSLQGSDAANALVAAFSDLDAHNDTYTDDTYAIVPFQVTGAGYSSIVSISGTSADTGVTISADGSQSYYLGEKVVLQGQSPDADIVYLLLTGPNLPAAGVNLASPDKAVISGNPDSFTVVKTKPDKTWEYAFYTANLKLDAGTYTIYALSQPKTEDQPGPNAANVSLILRKPYITTGISPATISKGQQFTITGSAAGNPPAVQIWIIGDNYVFNKTSPVNLDASFTFKGNATMSGKLPKGQNYLIVQHPMEDNQFDIVVSGDYVRNQKLNNGTNLFKITGPGSLQGSDAADALIAAFDDTKVNDDTYTIVPFQVTDAGIGTIFLNWAMLNF